MISNINCLIYLSIIVVLIIIVIVIYYSNWIKTTRSIYISCLEGYYEGIGDFLVQADLESHLLLITKNKNAYIFTIFAANDKETVDNTIFTASVKFVKEENNYGIFDCAMIGGNQNTSVIPSKFKLKYSYVKNILSIYNNKDIYVLSYKQPV